MHEEENLLQVRIVVMKMNYIFHLLLLCEICIKDASVGSILALCYTYEKLQLRISMSMGLKSVEVFRIL